MRSIWTATVLVAFALVTTAMSPAWAGSAPLTTTFTGRVMFTNNGQLALNAGHSYVIVQMGKSTQVQGGIAQGAEAKVVYRVGDNQALTVQTNEPAAAPKQGAAEPPATSAAQASSTQTAPQESQNSQFAQAQEARNQQARQERRARADQAEKRLQQRRLRAGERETQNRIQQARKWATKHQALEKAVNQGQ